MNITIEIAAQFTGTLTIKDVCTIEVTPPRLSNSEIAAGYMARMSTDPSNKFSRPVKDNPQA